MEDFDVSAFIDQQTQAIRDQLKDEKAIVAVSGGVDSTVSAIITHRAIGDNLVCVFIDDNFMRLGEAEQVKNLLTGEPLRLPLRVLNERQRFMEALSGISDAEEKRIAFRESFYKSLQDIAVEEGCRYLVQGTIRADVEETSSGIKTQHNILEQIGIDSKEKYGFQIIEPLKTLYKYQVREVARKMMLPPELAERQPFPGPGLSIRVVGELTNEKLDELKKATFIVEEQLNPHSPDQYFAAIFSGEAPKELKVLRRDAAQLLESSENNVRAGVLVEKTTGIVNGKRAYGTVLTMALIDDSDRTIDPNYDQLAKVRNYVFDNYPEATRLILLIDKRDTPGFIVTIRAVKTKDFLTAKIMRLPWSTLREAATKIFDSCPNVSRVYYDITPKPPATIEYE
ncbi:MAG: GMP synthase [Candidatus Bathyarchaeota archaeon]